MNNFAYYADLRDTGASPEQVVATAMQREPNTFSYIRLLRYLFGFSLEDAHVALKKGEDLYFLNTVVSKYRQLHQEGSSYQEIYGAMREDVRLSKIDHYRVFLWGFGLSFKDTQQIVEAEIRAAE